MSIKNLKTQFQMIFNHSGKLVKSYALDVIIRLIVALLLVLLFIVPASAQNIGVNNPTPHAKALLDLTSNNKGLLVPRMTEAERTAIFPAADATAKGMIVYQTDNSSGFWYYDGSAWKQIFTSDKGWSTTGNAGTVDGVNFLGTTDNVPLSFRVNNQKVGKLDPAHNNIFFGLASGANATTGSANVFLGDSSGV